MIEFHTYCSLVLSLYYEKVSQYYIENIEAEKFPTVTSHTATYYNR